MGTVTELLWDLESKDTNDFVRDKILPLGMKNIYSTYQKMKKFPDDDLISLSLDKREVKTMGVFAYPGAGKTKLMKRIVDYFHRVGYKIFIIDPKEAEYSEMADSGKLKRIHPLEEPRGVPIKQFVPLFTDSGITKYYVKNFTKFCLPLSMMTEPQDWATLGIIGRSAQWMAEYAKHNQNIEPLVDLLEERRRSKKIHPTTRIAIEAQIFFLINDHVFDGRTPHIPIKELWDQGYAIVVSYFMKNQTYRYLYTGKLLEEILWLGQRHKYKILVLVDDCYLVFPREGDVQFNIAKQKMRDLLASGRKMNINVLLGIQSLSLIDPVLIDNMKTKIIGRMGNPEELMGYFSNPAIMQNIKNLRFKPERLISEFMLVREDGMRFQRFFPFDPLPYHEV